jgi:hypothetical protein
VSGPSAPEVARRLADGFEAAKIPHAIGGALALGVWGFPRATKDVDVDVFVEPAELEGVFDVLERAGCTVDREEARAQAIERGDFQAWAGAMRVDVFVPSIPFYESMRRRIRRARLEGRPAWFLAPEDLCVMKLLFFRAKDLIDVERLVAALGTAFDREYVTTALVDIVGAEDTRLERWKKLLADVDAASA